MNEQKTDLEEIVDIETNFKNIHFTLRPHTRKRRIIFHYGPPNSGKTYTALQDFLKASSGIYCCPLRLLAQEIFQKAQQKGVKCDLETGEEIRIVDHPRRAKHIACTVHMADRTTFYDVAIIDEIQRISDAENGWAFTKALFGLNCRTLHLCGDECAYDLVNFLVAKFGEIIEREKYRSRSHLSYLTIPLNCLTNAKLGDCIVCFSVQDVRRIAQELENHGTSAAIVYGSLPPETKKNQIEKFNSGEKKVLVATDAIGMGLNANIKRMIFYKFSKHSKNSRGKLQEQKLSIMDFKQIAGRAGRDLDKGQVMAMYDKDVDKMNRLQSAETPTLQTARILPPVNSLINYVKAMEMLKPGLEFDQMLEEYLDDLKLDKSLYSLSDTENIEVLSRELNEIPLNTQDMYHKLLNYARLLWLLALRIHKHRNIKI